MSLPVSHFIWKVVGVHALHRLGGHHGNVTAAVPAVQIAWTYLLSRAASDAQPLDSEEDDRLVEAHPS